MNNPIFNLIIETTLENLFSEELRKLAEKIKEESGIDMTISVNVKIHNVDEKVWMAKKA